MSAHDHVMAHRLGDLRELTKSLNLHTPPAYFASAKTMLPYEEALVLLRDDDSGRPLSLYLGIPLCVEHCNFCMYFYGLADRAGSKAEACVAGIEALLRKIDSTAGRPVAGSYIGGGTPTVLTAAQIERLLTAVNDVFVFEPGAQRTFEMSPGTMSEDKARAIVAGGYHRVSFGVQSFVHAVVKAAGRTFTPADEARALIRYCRNAGATEINIDLMVGLAEETDESVQDSVAQALTSECTTISVYRYRPARGSEVRSRGGIDRYVATCAARVARLADLATRHGWEVEGRADGEHVRLIDPSTSVRRSERNYYETRFRPQLGNSLAGIGSGARSFQRDHRFVYCAHKSREGFDLAGRLVEVQDCDLPSRVAAALVNELFREWTVDLAAIEQDVDVTVRDLFGAELAFLLGEGVLVEEDSWLTVAPDHRTDWMYYEKLLYPSDWLARRSASRHLRAR